MGRQRRASVYPSSAERREKPAPVITSAEPPELGPRDGLVPAGRGAFPCRRRDGRRLDGVVRYVARRANPATRTFRVELEAPNADLAWVAGATVRLVIALPPRPAARRTFSCVRALTLTRERSTCRWRARGCGGSVGAWGSGVAMGIWRATWLRHLEHTRCCVAWRAVGGDREAQSREREL